MPRFQQLYQALGSVVYITLVAGDNFPFETIFSDVRAQITAFEQRFSRFLPESELTLFNEHAGEIRKISTEFKKLLLASIKMAELTEGVYNPFTLPALQQAGYKGSWPSPDKLAAAKDYSQRKVVPSSQLQIYDDSAKIPSWAALDFGGIGKGFLLDQLHSSLLPIGAQGYWLSLGGDILCAGKDLENTAWTIQIQQATNQDASIAAITNHDGKPLFIATSGITKRQGRTANGTWHHLINPKTGAPAKTDILTATVAARSGIAADVFAKTIVIAGSDQATNFKQAGHIESYVLQYRSKEPTINL